MNLQIKSCGSVSPTIQSRLSFSQPPRATSPSLQSKPVSPILSPQTSVSQYEPSEESQSQTLADSEVNEVIDNLSRASTPLAIGAKNRRKRTGWVYKHMARTDDMQAVFVNKDGLEVWPCRYCAEENVTKEFLTSGGTANIERHLKKHHNIFETTLMQRRLQDQQLSIEEAMESAQFNTTKKRKLTEETLIEKALDGKVLESLFVRWIATDNQALRLVEHPEFRAFLTYLNSNVNVYLTNSHSTCGEWVLTQYLIEKERIRLRLHSTLYKIHISLDIWTSPNNLPVLGIVAHYINEEGTLEHSVLALREIQGGHEGENTAPIVLEVLEEWGILSKIGYFQMDNDSKNDTLLRAFSRSKQIEALNRIRRKIRRKHTKMPRQCLDMTMTSNMI